MVRRLHFLLLLLFLFLSIFIFYFTTFPSIINQKLAPKANSIHFKVLHNVIEKSEISDTQIIVQPSCDATFVAWIVTSYAGDPSPRSALRRAYVDRTLRRLGVRRIFLLGTLTNDGEGKTHVSRAALLDESLRFNDILLGDFLDTYRNLTRKHLMGLEWAVRSCERVRYIMKTDDDVVVDVYGVLDQLHRGMMDQVSLAGYLMRNMTPVREPANKWYVSEVEYAGSAYPDFVSGWLYVVQPQVASRLIERAKSTEYFWIDDVFVTGVLRQASSAEIRDIRRYYTTDYRYLECCIKGGESLLKCEFLVGPNGGDTELQVRFAKFVEFCRTNCSTRTESNLVGKTCVAAYKEPSVARAVAVQIDAV